MSDKKTDPNKASKETSKDASQKSGPKKQTGPEDPKTWPKEHGGPEGPEPTRYGDWEVGGRCTDF